MEPRVLCKATPAVAPKTLTFTEGSSSAVFPNNSGSLRTVEDGKDFRMLYRRWHRCKPSKEDLIDKFAHALKPVPAHLDWDNVITFQESEPVIQEPGGMTGIKAIKLSQAGALVAWSVGTDKTLHWTDVTTCKTRRWFTVEDDDGFSCLDVPNADGWVFTGGEDFICWDPRQYVFPIFKLDYYEATQGSSTFITAMISEESSGQAKVLTAGDGGDVCLWDVRQTNQILRRYGSQGDHYRQSIDCLAVEPRRGTLISGGLGGLSFWNLNTGDPWATPGLIDPVEVLNFNVQSIAVGTERMIVGCTMGVFKWAIPDPPAVAMQLQGVLALPHEQLYFHRCNSGFALPYRLYVDGRSVLPGAMQGVGEGPAGILAGTADGSIGMWECLNNPEQAQQQWDHLRWYNSRRLHPSPILDNLHGLPIDQQLGPNAQPIVAPPPQIVQPPPPPPYVAPVGAEQLQEPVMWSLKPCPGDLGWRVSCLAATDEIVVNGFSNGKIRIARMKEQF